jgi:hypothetical protein
VRSGISVVVFFFKLILTFFLLVYERHMYKKILKEKRLFYFYFLALALVDLKKLPIFRLFLSWRRLIVFMPIKSILLEF